MYLLKSKSEVILLSRNLLRLYLNKTWRLATIYSPICTD